METEVLFKCCSWFSRIRSSLPHRLTIKYLLIFQRFIPRRDAHCQIVFGAVESHISLKWNTFPVAVLKVFCLLCHESWALTKFLYKWHTEYPHSFLFIILGLHEETKADEDRYQANISGFVPGLVNAAIYRTTATHHSAAAPRPGDCSLWRQKATRLLRLGPFPPQSWGRLLIIYNYGIFYLIWGHYTAGFSRTLF